LTIGEDSPVVLGRQASTIIAIETEIGMKVRTVNKNNVQSKRENG
jgi:hypothetical protein